MQTKRGYYEAIKSESRHAILNYI